MDIIPLFQVSSPSYLLTMSFLNLRRLGERLANWKLLGKYLRKGALFVETEWGGLFKTRTLSG